MLPYGVLEHPIPKLLKAGAIVHVSAVALNGGVKLGHALRLVLKFLVW